MAKRRVMTCRGCGAELGFNNIEMEAEIVPVTCKKCGVVNNIVLSEVKDDNRSAVAPEVFEDKDLAEGVNTNQTEPEEPAGPANPE